MSVQEAMRLELIEKRCKFKKVPGVDNKWLEGWSGKDVVSGREFVEGIGGVYQ